MGVESDGAPADDTGESFPSRERRARRRPTLRVGWGLERKAPPELSQVFRLVEVDPSAAQEAQVIVVSAEDYDLLARERQTAVIQPVLVLCEPDQIDGVIPLLREDDDVTFCGVSTLLLKHRVARLGARRARVSDPLTGLAHRWRLRERLSQLLATVSEAHEVSIVLSDIDHFKSLNDRYGHLVGDEVLRQLGRVLREASTGADLIARYSGEQFVVVLQCGELQALDMAERARQAIDTASFPDDLEITVSLGVATAEAATEPSTLLTQAQEAMYAAKAQGRNRIVSYNELERRAWATHEDVALASFENLTRVVSERIAMMINQRGRQLFQQIRHEADVDVLTQVYTRRYFERRLGHEFSIAAGQGQPLTVALIDIDFFGEINKRYGWPTGDRVLAELAGLIRSSVRNNDWVARYGGEEFCLIMPETSLSESYGVLERLRQTVEDRDFTTTTEEQIRVTVSIGAAERRELDEGLASLIERTSSRLLLAKRGGRNRVCY
jgi:two-component system cell cycle response regulator